MKGFVVRKSYLKSCLMFLIVASSLISGCVGGESSGSSDQGGGDSPIVLPESVSVTLKSGNGFECFVIRNRIYCSGSASSVNLSINSIGFSLMVADSDSNILDFETWDDTLCWTVGVAERPHSRSAGVGTYCIGEATLAGSYAAYPIVYSGPNYVTDANGANDLEYEVEPFMGGDITMTDLLNSTFMTDGVGSVSETEESCTILDSVLTCESFVLVLQ